MIRRSVQLGSATIIASIRIAILVGVLHRTTQASWQKLTIITSCVVLGLVIAPHLIGHRARQQPLLPARP
jgi:carbon starvation protein CstA